MKVNESINLEQYVTVNQIRKAWNISRTTVYDLFNEGTLTKFKVKGGTRIKLSEVNAYMESQNKS